MKRNNTLTCESERVFIMKLSLKAKTGCFLLILLFGFSPTAFAKYHFDFTPSISVSEVYDDNIYLNSTNEKSDYITTVTPGFNLNMVSEKSHLELSYAPGFVWYDKEDQNDTVRHSGTLTFGQDLTQHLSFDLTDTYMKSEDPLEDTEDIEGVRNTRNTYERNTALISLRYLFGPENELTVGYGQSQLENEDKTVDDGRTQDPSANVTYWFNVKNGMELNYGYTKADFWRDDNSIAGDDYTGHSAGITYIYRFTPHTRGSIGYDFATRDFDGSSEDYNVHTGSVGFDHQFSPDMSLTVEGGYFIQKNDRSDDENGYTYNASLIKRFERGSITVGGTGGWDENYLDAERRGFSRYWSVDTNADYQLLESLSGYVGGSYRFDKDVGSGKREAWRGNCGIRWAFLRWFSLSLDYSHAERDDDNDIRDYSDNRVMLILNASKLYRW
ncbi:MAG: outer membrane beta-barrel protein [Deltaproteobacteria bacterium]|nr:outer membrane beta-barrel protein [Deltaproteobacteria bacterium]